MKVKTITYVCPKCGREENCDEKYVEAAGIPKCYYCRVKKVEKT